MPRRPAPQQLELFTRPSDADRVPAPHWQTLPQEARGTLTELMIRLILDHAAGAHANRWTRERVTALRSHHKIPVFRPAPDGIEPWLNLTKSARLLGVTTKTLGLAAEAGGIQGVQPFDPYPFILLNLVLSSLAALQAPIIMMSQRRQDTKDRIQAENDYRVNLKAELEIRQLHEKMDHQLAEQWNKLAEMQQIQIELLEERVNERR